MPPQLANVGTFSFHPSIKPADKELERIAKLPAIDIISSVLRLKFEREGKKNRLYLLNGRTGSGKSTYFLQELYIRFVVGSRAKIICTEPQVVLTESNARDIINYSNGWELGKQLGVKSSRMNIRSDLESIVFYTTQIFNDELMRVLVRNDTERARRFLRRIKFIIIDEVHSLDLPMMSILRVLRDFINKFGNLPEFPMVIFASATMDLDALSEYFDIDLKNPLSCAIISGSPNHPVDEYYLSSGDVAKFNALERTKNDNRTSYNILADYVFKNVYESMITDDAYSRDTLVFVPGILGIQIVGTYLLRKISDIGKLPCYFIKKGDTMKEIMHWRTQNKNVKRVLIIGFATDYSDASNLILSNSEDSDEEALKNEIKMIVATTALETGKTLYHVKYVFDMGLQTKPIIIPLAYDPNAQTIYNQLPENKNQMVQRSGRVGRVASGKSYHFYTKEVVEMFEPTTIPQTVDSYCLSDLFIHLLATKEKWQMRDIINENDFIYPASVDNTITSVKDLIYSGYLTPYGELTTLWHSRTDITKQRVFSKYMYEVLGYKLFDVMLFVISNVKKLPSIFDVSSFKIPASLIDNKAYMNNTNPTHQMIEQIRRTRGEITLVQYGHSILGYHKKMIF